MTRPFIYTKVSPTKYVVQKYHGECAYRYGTLEQLHNKKWVWVSDEDEVPYLFDYEMSRIGRKLSSLNKELK